ncbi:zinc ribbon domain-containing protein [bacterium]|nr:zinc ribbon domain-containing protein [bacterium]
MENIICKACSASIEKDLEFCSSCGEWLGLKIQDMEKKEPISNATTVRNRVPQIKCPNCVALNPPSIKNCKECGNPLIKPLSSYGAADLPNRKEVPGIRAVFFLALIVPLIAGASFFYNSRIADDVIEEIAAVEQTTSTSSSTTIQSVLQKMFPISCASSSQLNDEYSCENLYDGTLKSWQDNELECVDGFLEFTFSDPMYLEFIVFQNLESSNSFKRNFKVRDIQVTTDENSILIEKELQNNNGQQWIDINSTTATLRIDILSAYSGEDIGNSNAFKECAIQELTFFGKG